MSSMILHDTRLEGRTPLSYNFVYMVNQNNHIRNVVDRVAVLARSRTRLGDLHIFCHGYETTLDIAGRVCVPDERGGFGLHLCAEGLTLRNVGLTAAWNGLVRRIILFACAPADTGSGNHGTIGDGRRFCGEMALYSGAEVIASSHTQYYNTVTASYSGGRSRSDTIDFGQWEGTVYSFSPNNGQPTPITPGSYNMSSPTRL